VKSDHHIELSVTIESAVQLVVWILRLAGHVRLVAIFPPAIGSRNGLFVIVPLRFNRAKPGPDKRLQSPGGRSSMFAVVLPE